MLNIEEYEAQGLKVPQPDPTRRSKGPTDHEADLETSNAATLISLGVIVGYILLGVVAFHWIFGYKDISVSDDDDDTEVSVSDLTCGEQAP